MHHLHAVIEVHIANFPSVILVRDRNGCHGTMLALGPVVEYVSGNTRKSWSLACRDTYECYRKYRDQVLLTMARLIRYRVVKYRLTMAHIAICKIRGNVDPWDGIFWLEDYLASRRIR